MLGADRYPHVAAIVIQVKCCKNVVIWSKRRRIKYRRNESYTGKEIPKARKRGKVSCISWHSIRSHSTRIKLRKSKYYKGTVTAKVEGYIRAEGIQMYIRSCKAESIKAEVDVNRTAYEKKVGKGTNVLIVCRHWVHEDPLPLWTGSIEQRIEGKEALVNNKGKFSPLGDRSIPINVKVELSAAERDREVEGRTGSIEQVVEEKAASVRVASLSSHSGAVNISVSVKMEPSVKEGDQEVEMNRVQHGATPGEFLRLCMNVITVNRCPEYIICEYKRALFDLCSSNKPLMCVNRYSITLYTIMRAIFRNATYTATVRAIRYSIIGIIGTYTATMCVKRYFNTIRAIRYSIIGIIGTYNATICGKRYLNTLYRILCAVPINTVYINKNTVRGNSTVINRAEYCEYYVIYNPVDRMYMYTHKVTSEYTCNTVLTKLYWGYIGSNRHGRYGE
jgi:hypothetical protein